MIKQISQKEAIDMLADDIEMKIGYLSKTCGSETDAENVIVVAQNGYFVVDGKMDLGHTIDFTGAYCYLTDSTAKITGELITPPITKESVEAYNELSVKIEQEILDMVKYEKMYNATHKGPRLLN